MVYADGDLNWCTTWCALVQPLMQEVVRMSRFTITVEEDLMEAAMEALGTRSKVDTVRRALSEVLRRTRLAQVLEHQGKVELDLTQEELRKLRSSG